MILSPPLATPLGPVVLVEEDGAIAALHWGAEGGPGSPLLDRALGQLRRYFDRGLTTFDLPIAFRDGLTGAVQRQMAAIPMGETRSYGDLARALAVPAQAVGQACGANPLPILVPCHRVLSARGLGGFSAPGGVEAKVWLLRHEGAGGLLI